MAWVGMLIVGIVLVARKSSGEDIVIGGMHSSHPFGLKEVRHLESIFIEENYTWCSA